MIIYESGVSLEFEGFLDEEGADRIRGWVWSPARPQSTVCLKVLDRAGGTVAKGDAALFRGDLESAGKRGGYCGFDIALPVGRGPFKLMVDCAGAGVAVVFAEGIGRSEPDLGDTARLRGPDGIVGYLDRADSSEVSGWCHGPDPFAATLALELVEDGRRIAVARADRWRADLADTRQGDGRCGFRFEWPDASCDGVEHVLDLRLAAGASLSRAFIRVVTPETPPDRTSAPAPRPASQAPPVLSIIVNFYDMRREAARTLHSLSRAYQRDIEHLTYEVLCIDNGSMTAPLDEAFVTSFGAEFRLLKPSAVLASPCRALNEAAAEANGCWLAVMIDGAHLLSPGALSEAHAALQACPGAMVALRQWFVGGDQRWFSAVGYSQAHEDVLFTRIGWPDIGYRIFEISSPMFESPNSWFDGLSESNCLFLPAELYHRLGGFDEGFDAPGAGFANLDLFRRAADAADAVISLVGEASFHQYHGGTTTNVEEAKKDSRVRSYATQYMEMRGADFASVPFERLRVAGGFRASAAMTARQRPPTPLQQGLTTRIRPRTLAMQFDSEAQHYLQAAYVETGLHHLTRWRGRPLGLAPADLIDLQEALWRAKPDVVVLKDCAFPLVEYVASLLRALELDGVTIIWVAGPDAEAAPLGSVRQVSGDGHGTEVLARILAEIGAAEHVMAIYQPTADEAAPNEVLARYGALITVGSYLVVLGAAFGQPWIGYSRSWTYRAILAFVRDHPAFVVDRTMNRHLVTTSPNGFLRRVLDPSRSEQYDATLDDLSGL